MVREHRVSRTTNMSWIQVTFYGLFCSVFQVYERRICWWLILLHPPEINYLSKLSTAAGFQPRVVHSHSIFVQKKNKTKTLAKKHGNGPGAKKGAKCLDFWVFCWQGSHWPKGSPWNPSLRITPHHSPSLLTPTNTTWKIKNHLLHISAVHFLSGLRKMDMPRWARQLIKCPWVVNSWTTRERDLRILTRRSITSKDCQELIVSPQMQKCKTWKLYETMK